MRLADLSMSEKFRALPLEYRKQQIAGMTDQQLAELRFVWANYWARPKQQPPPGDWATWVVRAGRSFGKTRCGSGWVHKRAMETTRWMAMVARTPADARDNMIESPGGILASTPPDERPNYEPSKRRITWSNGSWATIYSDEEPDQLRGFSGDTAWLDEFAKFQNPRETWDNLAFGMREISSDQPRRLITTTPRPLEILREIEKLPSTVVVIGSSFENVNNVHAKFYEDLKRYEGTRIGRQEINAEIVDDMPGALWTRALLEASRVTSHPEFKRVVVGVDPSGTAGSSGESSNKVGIVCVGLGINDLGYVLEDATCSLSPAGWGRRVFDLASMYKADRIVVERNFGGAMAEHVLRTIDLNASIKMVTASRGKVARAEPVAALYEKGRIKHVKPFPTLEDQLIQFLPEGYVGESSPDAADAAIWAITELMLPKRWMVDQTGAGLPITG